MGFNSGFKGLTRLDEKIREKTTRFAKEKIKSSSIRTMHPPTKVFWQWEKLRDLHYELLKHPPYSPDLAPSDFYLFPKLKIFLAGQRFFFFFRIKRRLQL